MTAGYLARRLLQIVPSVAGILIITFLIVHLAPGDPVVALAGESGNAEYYRFIRQKFGLDQPLHEQFFTYAANVVRGNLGHSFVQGRPVAEIVLERLRPTLLLMGTALLLSSVAGMVLGALAARRPFSRFDLGVSTTSLIGHAIPSFWLAQLALLFVAVPTGAFPIYGMTDARAQHSGFAAVSDIAHHMVLPVLVLTAAELALITRLTRSALRGELGKDYVRTARAKGLGEGRLLRRHALPNALRPVLTAIGARVGFLFSGAVLVETVFAWPGLGRLLLTATQTRDHPVLLGMVLLVAASVVTANLVTDLVYASIDPRVRYR